MAAHSNGQAPTMAGVAVVGGQTGGEPLQPPAEPLPVADSDVDGPLPDDGAPDEDQNRRFMWLIPALIAGVAIVVIALFSFGVLDGPSDTPAAPPTTVVAAPTTVVPTTDPPPTTTTPAPTTTSTSTTTTIPAPSSLAAVGNAIPFSSLTLRASGIGPITFGDAAPDAIGRLIASLGAPAETGVAGEAFGLCAGDDGRFARWGGLTAIISGTLADGTFAGYRYKSERVPTMHLDLATPSRLRVGDSVATLNRIYASYQIDYVSSEGTDIFRLSDADGLLLWGPVSSTEDSGRVEGINAPDLCSP